MGHFRTLNEAVLWGWIRYICHVPSEQGACLRMLTDVDKMKRQGNKMKQKGMKRMKKRLWQNPQIWMDKGPHIHRDLTWHPFKLGDSTKQGCTVRQSETLTSLLLQEAKRWVLFHLPWLQLPDLSPFQCIFNIFKEAFANLLNVSWLVLHILSYNICWKLCQCAAGEVCFSFLESALSDHTSTSWMIGLTCTRLPTCSKLSLD